MRIDIVTLFPELFSAVMQHGVIRRAFTADNGATPLVDVHFTNPRDFADGNYRRVDDRPFGGGPGMVMMAEPLARAIEAIRAERASVGCADAPVILFSPGGSPIRHARIAALARADLPEASNPGAVLICGRYEGIDQRFIDRFVTEQWSLGEFVLSGGEIPAAAVLDAVARLQPGVLTDGQSHLQDSFNPAIGGLLDCPHYTRPEVWRGDAVPSVLLSGNHAAIEKWRTEQRLANTSARRTSS